MQMRSDRPPIPSAIAPARGLACQLTAAICVCPGVAALRPTPLSRCATSMWRWIIRQEIASMAAMSARL